MNNKFIEIFFIISLLLIFGCGQAWAGVFGPYKGKIVDAETHEPVEGVVVLIEWRHPHFFAGSTFMDAQETPTDKNGEFVIPGIWVWNPWKRWLPHVSMVIYKSGYRAIETGGWQRWKEWAEPDPKISYVLKVEDGKRIILLKKLTLEERRQFSTPDWGDIPNNKVKLFIQEINKERNFLGLEEYTVPLRR